MQDIAGHGSLQDLGAGVRTPTSEYHAQWRILIHQLIFLSGHYLQGLQCQAVIYRQLAKLQCGYDIPRVIDSRDDGDAEHLSYCRFSNSSINFLSMRSISFLTSKDRI